MSSGSRRVWVLLQDMPATPTSGPGDRVEGIATSLTRARGWVKAWREHAGVDRFRCLAVDLDTFSLPPQEPANGR